MRIKSIIVGDYALKVFECVACCGFQHMVLTDYRSRTDIVKLQDV